jgi:hypothetical protein
MFGLHVRFQRQCSWRHEQLAQSLTWIPDDFDSRSQAENVVGFVVFKGMSISRSWGHSLTFLKLQNSANVQGLQYLRVQTLTSFPQNIIHTFYMRRGQIQRWNFFSTFPTMPLLFFFFNNRVYTRAIFSDSTYSIGYYENKKWRYE